MMRWFTFLCASIAGFGGSASSIEDYHYSGPTIVVLSWLGEKGATIHDRAQTSTHYVHGWKEGYFDVCMGNSGEPPVVPPNKYWVATITEKGERTTSDRGSVRRLPRWCDESGRMLWRRRMASDLYRPVGTHDAARLACDRRVPDSNIAAGESRVELPAMPAAELKTSLPESVEQHPGQSFLDDSRPGTQ